MTTPRLFAVAGLSTIGTAAQAVEAPGSLDDANSIVLWICAVLAMAVLSAIVYSVAVFRHADAQKSVASKHSRNRELFWALVPMAIVIAAAAPAVRDAEPQLARQQRSIEASIARADHAATTVVAQSTTHR